MLKKLLAAFGKKNDSVPDSRAATAPTGLHAPYTESHTNFLYNLLFCDELDLFKDPDGEPATGALGAVMVDEPDKASLSAIANDENIEGRVRALAFNRLRALGETVTPKKLLGVVVEVPLAQGLDVLAAFSDGGTRYLNQSGKVVVSEGTDHPIAHTAKALVVASQSIVDKIGPWEEQRLPPPKTGNVRITFLVSDGLYFGEGAFSVLRNDAMAGPILAKATALLALVTETGTHRSQAADTVPHSA